MQGNFEVVQLTHVGPLSIKNNAQILLFCAEVAVMVLRCSEYVITKELIKLSARFDDHDAGIDVGPRFHAIAML